MKKLIKYSALVLLSTFACSAYSGASPSYAFVDVDQEENDRQIYVGLQWDLGESRVPKGLIGYRDAKVSSQGNVDGGDVRLSFSFKTFKPDEIKLLYINGGENAQAEVGGGYRFSEKSWLGVLGVQGPYVNFGLDYNIKSGISFSAALNSISSYDEVLSGKDCPSGSSEGEYSIGSNIYSACISPIEIDNAIPFDFDNAVPIRTESFNDFDF